MLYRFIKGCVRYSYEFKYKKELFTFHIQFQAYFQYDFKWFQKSQNDLTWFCSNFVKTHDLIWFDFKSQWFDLIWFWLISKWSWFDLIWFWLISKRFDLILISMRKILPITGLDFDGGQRAYSMTTLRWIAPDEQP